MPRSWKTNLRKYLTQFDSKIIQIVILKSSIKTYEFEEHERSVLLGRGEDYSTLKIVSPWSTQ